MATIYPFRALRPKTSLAAQVASVPYDVVTTAEARALCAGNKESFLHVTKPEIALPKGVDPYTDEVYHQGAEQLRTFIGNGTLVRDEQPKLYVYRLTMDGAAQTGFVVCASIADYQTNEVRKHEHTRPDKENDRANHMKILGAQSGTVFLLHRDTEVLTEITQTVTATDAPIDFIAPDGVRHQVWTIDSNPQIQRIVDAFAHNGPLYVADGHHRSAAAARVAQPCHGHGNNAQTDGFLAVTFPVSAINILPYNRVVKDMGGHTPEALLHVLRDRFDVTQGKPDPIERHQFGMFVDDHWYALCVKPGSFDEAHPIARLDVSLLQEQLLGPVFNIQDPRRDRRIDFVGGIRGDAELEKRVQQDGWAVAFKMYPTSIDELLTVADAREVMPPKSTWFEPKLRDGLFVHLLEGV